MAMGLAGLSATVAGMNTQQTTNASQAAAPNGIMSDLAAVATPMLTKESMETFLMRVSLEAQDLQKEVLYNFAQSIDNNNKELKQLSTANADLSALLALFPKDGDDKKLSDLSLRMPKNGNDYDKRVMKDAVAKVFADPNGPLPTVKSEHTDSNAEAKATTAMNKYLALVQSGLRSGVIKSSDQSKYQDLNVTKAELTSLQQALKTQTDDRSNISSKLQLAVNQYNSNVSNINQFIASLQQMFAQNLRNVVGKMG